MDYAREAISSAVGQDAGNIEVVVSDNSENDAVGQMVSAEFPNVTYIRRRPALDALQHFKGVIEESSADEVVLFHDDDILDPSYVRTMRNALATHPDTVAVGCNAKILRETTRTDTLFMTMLDDIVLTDVEQLLDFYLRFDKNRPAPFPGYMYRRSAIKGLYLEPRDGGKHADVTFLMKAISRGHFLWLAKPLMQYRMHGTNDSAVENVGHRLRLLRYIYRQTSLGPKSQAVQEFRFRYWARWLRAASKNDKKHLHRWRKRVVFDYLWRQVLRYALKKPGFWHRITSGSR